MLGAFALGWGTLSSRACPRAACGALGDPTATHTRVGSVTASLPAPGGCGSESREGSNVRLLMINSVERCFLYLSAV